MQPAAAPFFLVAPLLFFKVLSCKTLKIVQNLEGEVLLLFCWRRTLQKVDTRSPNLILSLFFISWGSTSRSRSTFSWRREKTAISLALDLFSLLYGYLFVIIYALWNKVCRYGQQVRMNVPNEENGTTILGSCEEVYCGCKSSPWESKSDDNHMSVFSLYEHESPWR